MWMIRLCLWCAHGCVVWAVRLSLVAALAAGIVVWAAHHAPVALPAAAVAGLEKVLSRRAGRAGLGVTLDGAEMALRGGLVPALSLQGVSVRAQDGPVLMALDRTEVVFSRRAALVGTVAPVAITARGLGLRLDRDAAGRISLRLGDAALVEAAPDPAAAVDRLRAVLDSPALAGLRRVGLEDVTLDLRDAVEGRVIRAGGGTLRLDRTGPDLELDMVLGMLGGDAAAAGGATVRIAVPGAGMAAEPRAADAPRAQLRVGLRGVEPARLAGLAGPTPLGASLSRIAAPVSLDLDGGLGPDGRALPLSGRLRVGAGAVRLSGTGDAVEIAGLGAEMRLSADRRHLELREMWLDGRAARLAGRADLRSDGAGGAITAQLDLREVAVDVPRAERTPVALRADRLWADLRVGGPGGAVQIAAMTLERDGARVTGTGRVWPGGRIALDLVAGPLAVDGALALWPHEIAPRARAWVAQTVSGGTLRDLRLSLRHDLRDPREPGRLDDSALSLHLENAAMRVDPRLPPIAGVTGQVVLDRDRVAFLLDRAAIALPVDAPPDGPAAAQAQTVQLGPGRIWTDTGPDATGPLRMVFDAAADLPAALALLRAPLFQPGGAADAAAVAGAGGRAVAEGPESGGLLMAPGSVEGRVAVTVDLALPLRRDGPPLPAGRRPDFTVTGTIRDAASGVLLPDRAIQAERLDLRADQMAVTLGGRAQVDDLPVDMVYSRALMSPPEARVRPVPRGGAAAPPGRATVAAPGRGRLVADFPLRPGDLAAAGLPLPAGALRGEGRGRIEVDFAVDGPPALTLDADLAGLAVSLPGLGVDKPARAPGRITAEGRLGPAPGLTAASLDMPGMTVRLRLPDGLSGGVRLDRLALGGWLDARGRFDPARGGAPARLVLTGGRADLRAMPRGGNGPGTRVALDLALDRVTLAEGIALTGLRGALSPDMHGTLAAQVNGTAPVSLRLAPGGDAAAAGPALHLTAADGGAVLRAAGLASGVRAGALDLRLVPVAGPGRYRGQLRLAGLTLPPGGAAALRAGAATDAAAGDGMAFEDVRAEFTLGPDRIDLHSASATGASLGLAVDGRVNLRDRTLALQGVASPLYFLNRMGAFMTRRGEGLIGLHFTLTGPMDAPDLNANPLSVLTPGPLREMFRSGPNAATPPEDRE
ncbi:hypothetical protein ACVDG3_13855 [Meridianimarinicoccus sp. RP-17]